MWAKFTGYLMLLLTVALSLPRTTSVGLFCLAGNMYSFD